MTVLEAGRVFQATLEARRAARHESSCDDIEAMDVELARAQGALEVAWLQHTVAKR